LIHDKASNQQVDLTAERIGSEVLISEGEFVRITIEIPRASYLYVIDREQYADKIFGPATLIFPTRRINLGNNRVLPGQIVQIPNWNDDPPYLNVMRNPNRNDQIAEVLTILVTTTPLDITVPEGAIRLSSTQVSDWESHWAATSERLELKGGSGQVRTKAEKAAVVVRQRLRQDEAPPQTIYRVDAKPNTPFMVDVKLTFTSPKTPVN